MEIIRSTIEASRWSEKAKATGNLLGFVPTMGALHAGHISLIEEARRQSDKVMCSIFVNPIQFNNTADLENYPRTLDTDLELLKKASCDMVFVPELSEVFPYELKENFDFGYLNNVLEGKFRPGHFNGVATVVKRLFEICNPDTAYFGEKDYQQLLVIKELVKKLEMSVEIIACRTLREVDGLAMSSRNMRLNKEERIQAAQIFRILNDAKNKAGEMRAEQLTDWVVKMIDSQPLMKLEYFAIADPVSLVPREKMDKIEGSIACIAVYVGEIRLIDNMLF